MEEFAGEGVELCELKGPGKLVSRRENLCVITILAALFQGNPCVSEYPVRKANRAECAYARSRARSPQKELIEMYPTA